MDIKEKKLIQETFEIEADEIGFCLDQKWGDYENPYENSDTALAFDLFKKGWLAKSQAVPDVLDTPARVGGGTFQKGVKWSTVIGAAQRHYDNIQTDSKPIVSPANMLKIASGKLVLVPKDELTTTYFCEGSDYVVNCVSEYEMELEKGEIAELEKWEQTKSTKAFFANIYSDEDNFEIVEFDSIEAAELAIKENKAMVEAQEQSHEQP